MLRTAVLPNTEQFINRRPAYASLIILLCHAATAAKGVAAGVPVVRLPDLLGFWHMHVSPPYPGSRLQVTSGCAV
jgi:hypothetical protein